MYGKDSFSGLSGVLELLVFHWHNRSGVILAVSDMMAPELLGISYPQHPQMSQISELCYDLMK